MSKKNLLETLEI